MLGSTILDVGIGLGFACLGVSLIASALTEGIASVMSWRSTSLLTGVKSLLNDPNFTGAALLVYNHGAANPLSSGKTGGGAEPDAKPSYIDPMQFANALLDGSKIVGASVEDMKKAITDSGLSDQTKAMLTGIATRAEGDIKTVKAGVADWFDRSMDRVSGAYKRRTQWVSVLLALTVAVSLNIDAVSIARAVWNQPMIGRAIVKVTDLEEKNVISAMAQAGLPVGWSNPHDLDWTKTTSGFISKLLGWLLIGASAIFGAPFWFDAVSRLINIRGSGPPAARTAGAPTT